MFLPETKSDRLENGQQHKKKSLIITNNHSIQENTYDPLLKIQVKWSASCTVLCYPLPLQDQVEKWSTAVIFW